MSSAQPDTPGENDKAFKAKLDLLGRRVDRGVFDMFQTLVGIWGETEAGPILSQLVRDHLVALSN